MPSYVRRKGLEPPRLSTLDPKSSAATNYANAATLVLRVQSYNFYLNYASVLLIFFARFIFLLLRWRILPSYSSVFVELTFFLFFTNKSRFINRRG